jgi:regulator of protease activity HflC (stomatin/prohibitin superfamily)
LPHIDWLWVSLIVLFLAYWIYMSALERVDSTPLLARFIFPDLSPLQVAALNFPPWVTGLIELFYPRVLRHLIPVFVGWWLAVEAAVSLIQVLYNCPDRQTARDFLRRLRRNRASRQETAAKVTPQGLDKLRQDSVLLRVGGPVMVLVPDGHAAVVERNARYRRVLASGVHELGRFEYVVAVIDLQPQERVAREIPLLSSDGIPMTTDASIRFRIDTGTEPTHLQPFPFNEEAVRNAAYTGAVAANGKISTWDDGPMGKVKGSLAGQVAQETLDKLIFDEHPREVHRDLTQAVTREVWDKLPKEGIQPLQLRIGRLTPPEAVSHQYTEYWLASQQKEDAIARANGTAHLVQEAEVARAEAEVAMLQAIVEGVRRAQNEAGSRLTGYLLALRLLESLRRMVRTNPVTPKPGGEPGDLARQRDQLALKLAKLEEQLRQLPEDTANVTPSV